MERLSLTQTPTIQTGMLIRKPISDVFTAFIDPAITTSFWFTNSSGKLLESAIVQWEWEMYDIAISVRVLAIEIDKRILVEWPGTCGPTTVEWNFVSMGTDSTFVSISNEGFRGTGDEMVKDAIGASEGFAFVLAGAKAFLEHGICLNLIADRFPESN